MCMCDPSIHRSIVAVTNRRLCAQPFLEQVERICIFRPASLVLREKDLDENAYASLAAEVLAICNSYQIPCILHSFPDVAKALGVKQRHAVLSHWHSFLPAARRSIPSMKRSGHRRLGRLTSPQDISLRPIVKKVSLQGGCSFFKRYANPYPFRSMRLAGSHLIHRRSKPSFPVVQAGFVLCLE